MFNCDYTRKTRSKPRTHPLLSALRYLTRPLYAQRKIFYDLPFPPASTLLANLPRKRLVFDRSLRQLRTERTLKARRSQMKQTNFPEPRETGHATFEDLGQEVHEVFDHLATYKVELSAEDKIFLKELGNMGSHHGFRKALQAARESAQRGERDAPKLERARKARAVTGTRDHENSTAARRAEKKNSENLPPPQGQPQVSQPAQAQYPQETACQDSQHKKAEAPFRKRVVDFQTRARRRGDLATQALLSAYTKQVAAAARERAAQKSKQAQQEASRQQARERAALAQVLAQNEALRKEKEAMAHAAEQARLNNIRQQEAMLRAERERQEAARQYQAYLQQQAQVQQQEAIRQHHAYLVREALRQQQEQAAREQAAREQAMREQAMREQAMREQAAREQAARERAAWEQAQREQAAREQAARGEAHQAAMYRREEALRQAASGRGALSPAAVQQEEEAFQKTKDVLRQRLTVSVAEALQLGFRLIPYEPEPINAFALYEIKWEELKANKAGIHPDLTLAHLPWPVFDLVTTPEMITYAAIHAFVFDETRPGMKNKTKRDRLRPEILRYHPDKFNNNVLPLVHPDFVEAVTATADRVAKFLNQLMELPM